MPARHSHFPNVFERSVLQRLQKSELKAVEVGSVTRLTKLVAKGWIERNGANDFYRITAEGDAAMRANMPFYKRPRKAGPSAVELGLQRVGSGLKVKK